MNWAHEAGKPFRNMTSSEFWAIIYCYERFKAVGTYILSLIVMPTLIEISAFEGQSKQNQETDILLEPYTQSLLFNQTSCSGKNAATISLFLMEWPLFF